MAGKKKGGLGRGLDYLFADGILDKPASVIDNTTSENVEINAKSSVDAKASDGGEAVVYIKLNDIKPNSAQPRKRFNEEALAELSESIKAYGVIQPVLLRPAAKGFELVAGERRWRAARLAGLKTIPAIVRALDDRQNAFYALIENMQREDLDPIEEAEGIMEIINSYGLTQEEAAGVIGKSRPYVTNSLRLMKLPENIREMVAGGSLSAGHARAIAGLSSEEMQQEAASKAVSEGWSVRQIENYSSQKTKRKKKSARSKAKGAEIRNAEETLTDSLGTKVSINGTERRGKIEIEYYSRDELSRLVELFAEP